MGGTKSTQAKQLARVMNQLNGTKVLILGNHDQLDMYDYRKYFKSVYGSRHFKIDDKRRFMLTHIPVHAASNKPKDIMNVHGHIHEKSLNDPRYFNISVEALNYERIIYDCIWISGSCIIN